jgi:hypothetical protein
MTLRFPKGEIKRLTRYPYLLLAVKQDELNRKSGLRWSDTHRTAGGGTDMVLSQSLRAGGWKRQIYK